MPVLGKKPKKLFVFSEVSRQKEGEPAARDFAADSLIDTADGQGRVRIGVQQDLGQHGSRGCFAMRAAYGDGDFVVFHHLSEQLCSCEKRNAQFIASDKFRIILSDGARVYDKVGGGCEIFLFLTIIYGSAFFAEGFGKRGFLPVGTGYPETFRKKNFGKTAHADTADAHEKNMNRMIKINLVHFSLHYFRHYHSRRLWE